MTPTLRRIGDSGWLVLIGGGEFSFEETELADAAWLAKLDPEATVGFLPAASGSEDYAKHFAVYLDEYFERRCETLPIYRARDARRGKNAQRVDAVAGVYVGGGVADHLVQALAATPSVDAMKGCLDRGGTVAAIAAGAQAMGMTCRSLFGAKAVDGLGWLPGGVVETNFDPPPASGSPTAEASSQKRLRRAVAGKGVSWGLGIPAGSAVLLGPDGAVEVQGQAWWLGDADDDWVELMSPDPTLADIKI